MALEVWFHRCASSFRQLLELLVAAYLTYEAGFTMWRKWERPDKKVEEEFTDALVSFVAYLYATEETLRLLWVSFRQPHAPL